MDYFLKGLGTYIIATVMMIGGIAMGLLLDDPYLRSQGAVLFLAGAGFWRLRTSVKFSDAKARELYDWTLQYLENNLLKKKEK